MTARALTELASKLGCRSAYELIVSKQYRNKSKSLRLFRDGEEIWPYRRDDKRLWFLGISGYGYQTICLTYEIAQTLTTTEREYRRLLNIPFEMNDEELDKVFKPGEFSKPIEETVSESNKDYYRTTLIISAMCVGAALAFYKASGSTVPSGKGK